jgi:hypothetical protein
MEKKYGNKSRKPLKKGARSSVGRAPQWHRAALEKSLTNNSEITFPENVQVVEIPDGWEQVPAMRMIDGRPVIHRVLMRITPKRLENDLKTPRRKKSA